jgi:hypothetical protein
MALRNVQDHHHRRMSKLEELIEDRRRRLLVGVDEEAIDGNKGLQRKLSDEELTRTQRQLQTFERKLQQMKGTNTRVSL